MPPWILLDCFEEDASARKKLAELLVSEPDARLTLINAVLRDVATRQDLERVREELKTEMIRLREELEAEIVRLEEKLLRVEERLASLDTKVSLLTRIVFAFNLPILLAVIGLLLKML